MPQPDDLSRLLLEVQNAAKGVNAAANSFLKIRDLLTQFANPGELEGTTTSQVAIEVQSEGAMPLPVGSEGTTTIVNNTNERVLLKTGSNFPVMPGQVAIDIPPGQSASVQKIQSDAPPLRTQVVRYHTFDPCFPPVPGTLCVLPPEVTRDDGAGPGDQVAAHEGWDESITIQAEGDGLSLTGQ